MGKRASQSRRSKPVWIYTSHPSSRALSLAAAHASARNSESEIVASGSSGPYSRTTSQGASCFRYSTLKQVPRIATEMSAPWTSTFTKSECVMRSSPRKPAYPHLSLPGARYTIGVAPPSGVAKAPLSTVLLPLYGIGRRGFRIARGMSAKCQEHTSSGCPIERPMLWLRLQLLMHSGSRSLRGR